MPRLGKYAIPFGRSGSDVSDAAREVDCRDEPEVSFLLEEERRCVTETRSDREQIFASSWEAHA